MPPELTQYMAQTGRFDLVSLLLASIGLILVAGGVFAFLNFKAMAKKHATAEAKIVAEQIAERVANEYLQRELPELLKEYREFMDQDLTDDDADRMAQFED